MVVDELMKEVDLVLKEREAGSTRRRRNEDLEPRTVRAQALAVLARRHGRGPTQVREIARAETLSAKYLEQLLGRLRAGGLVTSVRGARGGYQLSREPQAITVREVLVVLEGSLAPVGCVEPNDGACDEAACTAHAVWVGLHETVLTYLGSYTLADRRCAPSRGCSPRSPKRRRTLQPAAPEVRVERGQGDVPAQGGAGGDAQAA